MPGIAGIVSSLERDTLPVILSRMTAAMNRQGSEVRNWLGGGVGLSTVGRSAPSMLAERGDCVLALAGRVVPDETLAERLRMAPEARSPERMPQCLLDLYLHLGPQALEGLNGAYVAVIWDEPGAMLTIVGDRNGMEPLYYWRQGSRLVFASRVRAVAAHPRFNHRVDPVALFDLLAAEQMLDERTLFADAQALPPAARLTLKHEQFDVESYWSPRFYVPGSHAPDEDEAIDGMADRVSAAVARQLQSIGGAGQWAPSTSSLIPDTYPLFPHLAAGEETGASTAPQPAEEPYASGLLACLLLTGGLDSRLLAAALTRVADPGQVSAATIGHARARDVCYGAEIARATGLPHTILPSNPRYLADYAVECVLRTEGALNVHASWILGASAHLLDAGISAVITGVGAEAVSGRHWLAEQPVTTRQQALERFTGVRWAYPKAGGLLREEFREDAFLASRESLRHTLDAAPSDHLLGWADYFSYRQARRKPTGSILAEETVVLEPYFDNDLMDYVFRLPPAMRLGGQLFKKMILYRFPEVATIGYTDSGLMLADEILSLPRGRSLADWINDMRARLWKRAARALPLLSGTQQSDNPAHAIYYNTWLRTDARAFVTDLLVHEDLYSDFLDAARVHRLVEDHMTGRADAYRLVNAVVTFALWRKLMG